MRIILASQSPRRIELLRQFNLEFEIMPSTIEEKINVEDEPVQAVMALAFQKAREIAFENPDALVIASDTIVYDDTILGKPTTADSAKQMLRLLSGTSHYVYTGIALIHLNAAKKIVDCVRTEVCFNSLSDDLIDQYVKTGEPMDKAGAYGIQGLGSILVRKINGDYFNVMGLPLSKLSLLLKEHFDLDLL
ncbi:Maf family protein [Fusibacter tunisiensis]|jgi:septum formation protein|uniref:dTTP/UTP pyrophosphatase n=1 Tax=Fusibacter tunisiensis TaxID=1008308 RepID=A0ABS2MN02_9FIRM|nr:Maf family protein [Fusibacter tunisiensis]MBM7560763.1 septum formation protein [Fusibacter tunisiensis]